MVCQDKEHDHNNACSTGKNCPVKCIMKILLNTLIFTVIALGIQYLVWHVIFVDAVMSDEMADIWRPMDAPEWKLMPLATLLTGLFFAITFCPLYAGISTMCSAPPACKGAKVGILLSLIPAIACPFVFYLTQPISPLVAFACFTDHFFSFMIAGTAIGFIKGMCCKKEGACGTT